MKSNLETDIFNYKTPEFFINMKSIPDKTSKERKSFVLEEKRKCKVGININGINIPGSLYFHLNYYHLQRDATEKELLAGSDKKIVSLPNLRDNEWIVFNDYDQVSKNPQIYTLCGARQLIKTEFECSITLRELSIFKNTEALGVFQADEDKDTFVKKMRIAIESGQSFIIVPNIDKDWGKKEIRFGYTKQDGSAEIKGVLYLYNTQEGKKIQVGSGKALKHGSKVFYEDRVGNIEDCRVGDKIYGKDGNLTTILGVYPQGIVNLYEIEFLDGRKVVCSGDHLWTIQNTEVHKERIQTLNTEYLFKTFKRKYFNKKTNKEKLVNRYTIPNIEPLDFKEKNLLIEPYYLGLWLGDGTTNTPSQVTTADEEIVNYLNKYAVSLGGRLVKKDDITYKISHLLDFHQTPLVKQYQFYDLKDNKHIPQDYLYNSFNNRIELLKGLLDSDGYVDKNGRVSLSLSDKILHEDVLFLIRSLGINCTVTTKETSYYSEKYKKKIKGKLAYIIYIGTSDLPLFKLTRKLNRQVFKKRPCIGIENIKKVNSDYATCIKVDNKDSLFLTNDFVPTHNTVTHFFGDEVAKSNFRAVYDAIEPALLSDTGKLRCVPLFTFTGGEAKKAEDAKNLVLYPNLKTQFTTIVEDKVVGARVLFGQYRKDCKKPMKFSDYVGTKTDTWLDDYPILVTDFDYANKVIDDELEAAAQSPDTSTLMMKKVFFPRKLEDIFLIEGSNNFPMEAILQRQDWLKENYKPEKIELYKDINLKVKWRFSSLDLITKFPVNQSDNKIAPVQIFEYPIDGLPLGTYCMGVDSINSNESSDRINSLATAYILKRTHDPLGKFQYHIVASYAGRPKLVTEFYELCEMLADMYNAYVLPEFNQSFVDHFVNQNKGYVLWDTPQLSIDIKQTAFSSKMSSHKKGLNPTPTNQQFGMDLLVTYCKAPIDYIEDRKVMSRVLGVNRIYDYMLLEEMKNYKSKPSSSKGIHDGNYDRLISAYHALILANHLDKYLPMDKFISNKDKKEEPRLQTPASPFSSINRQLSTTGKKITRSPFLSL